jgi:DNA-3-methyladenine glycosylase
MQITRTFYRQGTLKVAARLLGKYLTHRTPAGDLMGKIVETEAYIGETDPACHAARGCTPRNGVMYGPPGYAYVYFTYGMHYMLNFVTEQEGFPAAVLIRALEPTAGIELMQKHRGQSSLYNLANGPGKLCQALQINRSLNGADLCGDVLFVEDRGDTVDKTQIIWTPRIGISQGTDRLWRCFIRGNKFVSQLKSKSEERRAKSEI